MKNKVISFIEAPTFKPYDSSLFPKSRYRDFKLIQFQLGVLNQSLREWVRPMDQLFKNFFVASNMRELYGDRISRLTDRMISGEKYANGESPKEIYEDLRTRAVEVRGMQHEVLSSLMKKLETDRVFKMHQGEECISNLCDNNKKYLIALFSKKVTRENMRILLGGVDASNMLSDDQLKSILYALESHGLVKNGEFTEQFKKEMIDNDPTLFEYEKQTPFKLWIQSRVLPRTLKPLIDGLKQQYLLTHLEPIKRNLVKNVVDADVGLVVSSNGFCSLIPFHVQLNRVIQLPFQEGEQKYNFIYLEDLVRHNLEQIMGFRSKDAETRMALFVRNVNVPFTIKDSPDERKVMARGVLARKTAEIVMIEVEQGCSDRIKGFLKSKSKFKAGFHNYVPILRGVLPIEVPGRIDARFVGDIYKAVDRKELKYEKYRRITPKYNSYVRYAMFNELLFQWPYHEFILDKVVNETIDIFEYLKNPDVLGPDRVKMSLYQSLYRTDEESAPMHAVERAAKAGVSAHIICEIKARLDEISNFKWARRLKEAGAHVHYSMMKRKIHTKVTVSKLEIKQEGLLSKSNFTSEQWQVMISSGLIEPVKGQPEKAICTKLLNPKLLPEGLRPSSDIQSMLPVQLIADLALTEEQQLMIKSADICLRITHVGTGNIREGSAKNFEDINVFSTKPSLGREAQYMFDSLEASVLPDEPEGEMWFGNHLKEHLREKISCEIAKGKNGYICIKVNQLEDDEMIDLLYQASQAGVNVDIFVRGFNIIRTANLEPLTLTNADIGETELKADANRIITNDQAINIWGKLKEIGVIDEANLISKDYMTNRNRVFSLLSTETGKEKATQVMEKVLDEAFKMRKFSENIRLYRVIDRHLEHSRIYIFGKGEDPFVVIGSADIMKRNLRKRQEADRVIKEPALKKQILEIVDIYKKNPAHMEIMTTNERYYLMDTDQTGKSVQEHLLPLYHHTSRDDGHANKWLFYECLQQDTANNIFGQLSSKFPSSFTWTNGHLRSDFIVTDEIISELSEKIYAYPGMDRLVGYLIKIMLQNWE